MELKDYFTYPYYIQALDQYAKFAQNADWLISDKLRLYNLAKMAFGSTDLTLNEKSANFSCIYQELISNWGLFRNAKGECWSSKKAFDELSALDNSLHRNNKSNLLDLKNKNKLTNEILRAFGHLQYLKPLKNYPWMAVSKVTHFYNPKLFPIYDTKIIWGKVMNKVFKADYKTWCCNNGFYWNTSKPFFSLQYMLWASDKISQANNNFMGYFRDWVIAQVDTFPDLDNIKDDLHEYYATAFEFVAIGAAVVEEMED